MTSSASSIESLHSIHSGRLLTLHLEKEHSAIWPSLIVGPVPESLSPLVSDPAIYQTSHELEHQFNVDPTSLVLLALELSDIRNNKEEAFEYLM
jgi:thiamine pyrophosphokinase